MKIYKKIFLVIVFVISNTIYCQELKDKWYFITFDMLKIVEVNFDSIKISSNNLNWDLSILTKNKDKKIVSTIEKSNKTYLITFDSIKNKVELMIIFDFQQGKSFRTPFLNEKSTFETIDQSLQFIKNDTIERFGIIYYSNQEIQRIKKLPSIQTINKQDFIKLSSQLQNEINIYKNNFQKMDLNFMFFYIYIPNKIRELITNLGYNGLVSDKDLGLLNNKFEDLPKL